MYANTPPLEEFEALVSPLQKRLYRTALILTKNVAAAETLIWKTIIEARRLYARSQPENGFDEWISQMLISNFTRSNLSLE